MNHRHLSFVLRVAELGSFSAAAAACSVTQPTLSAGVGLVEDHLGARLFDRNNRRVELTAFGRDILPAIYDVIASERALEVQAQSLLKPQGKMVRIGVSPIAEMSKPIEFMRPYREAHPEVAFIYKECFVDDLEARLSDGKIDLAIWPETSAVKSSFTSVNLYRDPWVFLPNSASQGDQMAAPCRVSDLAQHPLILTSGSCGLSQATQSMYARLDLKLTLYPGRAISYNAIEEWADLGLGSALLPASKVSRGRTGTVTPVLNEDRSAAMLDIVASWQSDKSTPAHLKNLFTYIHNETHARRVD